MVFEGGYHGGVLFFATAAVADERAVPVRRRAVQRCRERRAPDRRARARARRRHRRAAAGLGGVIPGEREFLEALREATAAHDVLLVFDEVMTSRLSTGGLQQVSASRPT